MLLNLPTDVLGEIAGHLRPRDRFFTLRGVCKRLQQVAETAPIPDLDLARSGFFSNRFAELLRILSQAGELEFLVQSLPGYRIYEPVKAISDFFRLPLLSRVNFTSVRKLVLPLTPLDLVEDLAKIFRNTESLSLLAIDLVGNKKLPSYDGSGEALMHFPKLTALSLLNVKTPILTFPIQKLQELEISLDIDLSFSEMGAEDRVASEFAKVVAEGVNLRWLDVPFALRIAKLEKLERLTMKLKTPSDVKDLETFTGKSLRWLNIRPDDELPFPNLSHLSDTLTDLRISGFEGELNPENVAGLRLKKLSILSAHPRLIRGFTGQTGLKKLTISYAVLLCDMLLGAFTTFEEEYISILCSFTQLRAFSLEGDFNPWDLIRALKELPDLRHFRLALYMSDKKRFIPDTLFISYLSHLKPWNLVDLELDRLEIGLESFIHLSRFVRLRRLQLGFTGDEPITDAWFEVLKFLWDLRSLRLSIEDPPISRLSTVTSQGIIESLSHCSALNDLIIIAPFALDLDTGLIHSRFHLLDNLRLSTPTKATQVQHLKKTNTIEVCQLTNWS